MVAFGMLRIRRLDRGFDSTASDVIPRETLLALVAASPLLAVLLSKNVVYGGWPTRVRILFGALAYASTVASCLHATFNVALARLRRGAGRSLYGIPLYWCAAMLVAAAVTLAFGPVFSWMEIPPDPRRRVLQTSVILSFYLAGAYMFKRATQRIADEQSRALKERAAAVEARFQALQARTNPHFLFNTLNSIMSLIGKDAEQAEQLLGRLSTLLRYSIEGADRAHISLREELDAVRDYLAIEQLRLGERLRFTLSVADDVSLAARVPPMVLQPLVENAIVHAVARSVRGGTVLVTVNMATEQRVALIVDDEGAPPDASPHVGTKTALSNLRERLGILYGQEATLTAGPRPAGGFRARVLLPNRRLP
jgi:two-component system sensor histidine kinase AlgZ